MLCKLTFDGKRVFGVDKDIISVSTDRAFTLMDKGYAVEDKNFMALYEKNQPKPEPEKELKSEPAKEVEVEKEKPAVMTTNNTPAEWPKKEKAVSQKAAGRQKAVKK